MKTTSPLKAHVKRAVAASENYLNNGHAWKVFAAIPVGIALLVVTGLAGRIIASAVAQDTGNRGAIIINGLPLSGSGVVVGIVAVGFIGAFLGFILYFVCSFTYWWFKT